MKNQSSKRQNTSKTFTVTVQKNKAAGGAAGAVVGGIMAGPVGAVVGGVIGTMAAGNSKKIKAAVAPALKKAASTTSKAFKKESAVLVKKLKHATGSAKKSTVKSKAPVPKTRPTKSKSKK